MTRTEANYPPNTNGIVTNPWTPIPLRLWFWIPLVTIMALGGIAFEVALYFSHKNQGMLPYGTSATVKEWRSPGLTRMGDERTDHDRERVHALRLCTHDFHADPSANF